jgi:hypothetical protein
MRTLIQQPQGPTRLLDTLRTEQGRQEEGQSIAAESLWLTATGRERTTTSDKSSPQLTTTETATAAPGPEMATVMATKKATVAALATLRLAGAATVGTATAEATVAVSADLLPDVGAAGTLLPRLVRAAGLLRWMLGAAEAAAPHPGKAAAVEGLGTPTPQAATVILRQVAGEVGAPRLLPGTTGATVTEAAGGASAAEGAHLRCKAAGKH